MQGVKYTPIGGFDDLLKLRNDTDCIIVFDEIFTPSGVNVYYPKLCYCTDNAAMIGGACYFMIKKGIKESDMSLDAKANVKLG